MRRIYINGEQLTLLPKNRVDNEVSQLIPGSVKWNKVVKITAIVLFTTTNMACASSTGGIEAIGQKAYDILFGIAGWYAIIGCALDLLKCGLNGTTGNAGKIVLNYLMIYASIAMLPWLIDTIKAVLR